VISCDTNILYHALDAKSRYHTSARAFLESLEKDSSFALCELVLFELYQLLRNPVVSRSPLGAADAVAVIQRFRSHPLWGVLDYPGPESHIMNDCWRRFAAPTFPYRKIYDARLALTLRYHGVTRFATRNIRDFNDFGFSDVWDPCL
jgi:uncharacterized protein